MMYVIEVIMSPLSPSEKFQLDAIVDDIMVPLRSSLRIDYPRCSFTLGITNLTLLVLVAISKPGSDMLYKASQRIQNAVKRGLKLNVEVDEAGNAFGNVGDDGDTEEDIVIADSLCEPTKMLYMLELVLAFHAWYKMGHPFCLKTKKG